jgi:hypothetical protein
MKDMSELSNTSMADVLYHDIEDVFGESVQWRWIRKGREESGDGDFLQAHQRGGHDTRLKGERNKNENRTWTDIDGRNRHDLNIGRKDMKRAYVS